MASKRPGHELRLSAGLASGHGDQAKDDDARELRPGDRIAERFEVRSCLGCGGMGAVYRVRDGLRKKDIALKVLLPSLLDDEDARERFQNELEVMLSLAHPGIVRVFDLGEDAPRRLRFFTMELLEGSTLRAWLTGLRECGEKVSLGEALEITRQLLVALEYAHQTTVHRDLKPENLILVEGSRLRLKVLDFGLARLFSAERLTTTAVTLGTAYYMAPEQQASASVTAAADLFSVAVILYEMLTDQLPVGRFSLPSEIRPSLPSALDEVVLKGLQSRPDRRYEGAQQFLDAIRSIPRFTKSQGEAVRGPSAGRC